MKTSRMVLTMLLLEIAVLAFCQGGKSQNTNHEAVAQNNKVYPGYMMKDSYGKSLPQTVPEDLNVLLVRDLLAQGKPVKSSPRLLRMGDAAAVCIIKVLGTRSPLNDTEILTALEIMEKAYEMPDAIFQETDRGTDATSFLLQYFASLTQDEGVKEEISTARSNISSSLPTLKLPSLTNPPDAPQ